jgi:hypothetical protein
LFGVRQLAQPDPMKEFLRLFPAPRLLRGRPREPVRAAQGRDLLRGLLACGLQGVAPSAGQDGLLTRGAAARLMFEVFEATDHENQSTEI